MKEPSAIEKAQINNIIKKLKSGKILTAREAALVKKYETWKKMQAAPVEKHAILKGKQVVFVEEYLKDLNATKAAVRAGYKSPAEAGYDNLRKPHIVEAINKAKTKRARNAAISAQWVLTGIKKIIRRCSGKEEFDPSNALKGYELIGRHVGMWDGEGGNDENKEKENRLIEAVRKIVSCLPETK